MKMLTGMAIALALSSVLVLCFGGCSWSLFERDIADMPGVSAPNPDTDNPEGTPKPRPFPWGVDAGDSDGRESGGGRDDAQGPDAGGRGDSGHGRRDSRRGGAGDDTRDLGNEMAPDRDCGDDSRWLGRVEGIASLVASALAGWCIAIILTRRR
jgi:hypothetical protein